MSAVLLNPEAHSDWHWRQTFRFFVGPHVEVTHSRERDGVRGPLMDPRGFVLRLAQVLPEVCAFVGEEFVKVQTDVGIGLINWFTAKRN